ncbi:MAG TPA: carbohydrate kinase family protein [Burkholderiaceae bacterium]
MRRCTFPPVRIFQHESAMTTKTIDLLCIGNPCADVVIRCERLPAWDDKCAGTALGTHAGGTEANVACAASRLGWRSAVLGEVGDDAHASFLIDAFVADQVSTRWLTQRAQCASASTMLMVSPEGERAIVWVPMPPAAWPPAEIEEALALSRWVYTMPYDLGKLATLHAAARRHGTQLAIDVEREAAREPGLLAQFLQYCDIAFMNQSGYATAFGAEPDEAGLRALRAQGDAHTIVVTLGSRGAIAIDANEVAAVPASVVDVVDTTGAGDTFNAAFLVAHARSSSLRSTLRFACDAAGHTVGRVGARSAMPHLGDVVISAE